MGEMGEHIDADEKVVWQRPEVIEPRATKVLQRRDLVETGLRLADAGGLSNVSFRKVAAEIGVGPMRIYRLVATKEELVDLLADEVYAEIVTSTPLDAQQTAKGRVAALAISLRRVAMRHPWFVTLLGGRPHLGPNALEYLELSIEALSEALPSASTTRIARARHLVHSYTVGALSKEVSEFVAERDSGLSDDDWKRMWGGYLSEALNTNRYPHLSIVIEHEGDEPDVEFETGLQDVLMLLDILPKP